MSFKLLGLPISLAVLGLAVFGSLAPDLDGSESKIKHLKIPLSIKHRGDYIKPFLPLSGIFHLLFGHRGAMHSLLAVFVLSGSALALHHFYGGDFLLYTAFIFGYTSHLLADSLTKSGIPLFYPYKKPIRVLPKPLALRTGSLNENLFFALLALILVLWLKTNPQLLQKLMATRQ